MEFNALNTIINFFESYKILILWLSSISLFIFLFSLVSMRWLAGLIPSDYFIKKDANILFKRIKQLIDKKLFNLFPAYAYQAVIEKSNLKISFIKKKCW